jgi:small multidrug resistance pump
MSNTQFAWLILGASVIAEVIGTIFLRYAAGFTKWLPTLLTLACYAGAIWLMAIAVKHLDVGLTYAVWAGTGTALTAVIGMLFYQESASLARLLGIGLVIAGVIVLNMSNSA